jgi:hypothetical protein
VPRPQCSAQRHRDTYASATSLSTYRPSCRPIARRWPSPQIRSPFAVRQFLPIVPTSGSISISLPFPRAHKRPSNKSMLRDSGLTASCRHNSSPVRRILHSLQATPVTANGNWFSRRNCPAIVLPKSANDSRNHVVDACRGGVQEGRPSAERPQPRRISAKQLAILSGARPGSKTTGGGET